MPETKQEAIADAKAEVQPPFEVSSTVKLDQLYTLIRQIILIVGGFTTIVGFLKTGDVAAAMQFIKDNGFIALVTGTITLGVMIYGNLRTRWNKQKLIVAADAAPNSVAVVKK